MAWLHTEIVDTIGPLEYILNTPSHHRVHHSRNPEYIDKNYGGMLIIWDRIFMTFKAEDKSNPPIYGLVHPVKSFDPIKVQFHTWPIIWRRIKHSCGLKNKLKVIFYGPGWHPGTPRLGDVSQIPKIVHPVQPYDPKLTWWQNSYVVVHFGLILLFYHELTLSRNQFSIALINVGVISLIVSITTIGRMLDGRHKYAHLLELIRCLIFFQTRQYLVSIMDHGMKRLGISIQARVLLLTGVYLLFALSAIINGLLCIKQFINSTSAMDYLTSTEKKKLI